MIKFMLSLGRDGTARNVRDDFPRVAGDRRNTVWVDVENPTESDISFLAKHFGLHRLTVEDCIERPQRTKIENYGDYFVMVLYGMERIGEKSVPVEVALIAGENFLVTSHRGPIGSIKLLREKCEKSPELIAKGPDFLAYSVADSLVDSYFPVIDAIEEKAESFEQKVFRNPSRALLNEMFLVQKEIILIRKLVNPQRDVYSAIMRNDTPLVKKSTAVYMRDVHDHVIDLVEMLDSCREIIDISLEAYMHMTTNKMNEIMKVLTVIATIFMPLSFIASVYGMNFRNMPELYWANGYYGAWAVMIVIAMMMVAYFRRKGWL